MLKIIIKKMLKSIFNIFCVITITFYLVHLLPSNLTYNELDIDDSMREAIIQKYDLDKSITKQYITYVKNILKGNLGVSMKYENKEVKEVIKNNFPTSLSLGFRAIFLSILIGFPLGIYSAFNKKLEKFNKYFSYIMISIPSFVFIGFIQLFVVYFNTKFKTHYPIIGYESEIQKILPVLSLSMFTTFMISRLVYIKVKEEIKKEYVQFSLSLGYDKYYIVRKHILKNILPTIISAITPQVVSLITGSFVVENLFGLSGLGRYYVSSIIDRDYTMVIGLTLFYSSILIIFLTLMDILIYLFDKRITGDIYEK